MNFSSFLPTENPFVFVSTTYRSRPFRPLAGSLVATTVMKSATVPWVVKILLPFSTKPPSTAVARVRSAAASDPAFGSVIANAAIFSPRSAGSRKRPCSALLPHL